MRSSENPLPACSTDAMLLSALATLVAAAQRMNFIEAHGVHLYDGARPFRYLGTNAYWLLAEASYGDRGDRHL